MGCVSSCPACGGFLTQVPLPNEPSSCMRKNRMGEKIVSFDEYLNSILGIVGAQRLKVNLERGKTIIISGQQGPTGKSVLKKVLIKKGYKAVELYNTYEVVLNEPLENAIPNFENQVK